MVVIVLKCNRCLRRCRFYDPFQRGRLETMTENCVIFNDLMAVLLWMSLTAVVCTIDTHLNTFEQRLTRRRKEMFRHCGRSLRRGLSEDLAGGIAIRDGFRLRKRNCMGNFYGSLTRPIASIAMNGWIIVEIIEFKNG